MAFKEIGKRNFLNLKEAQPGDHLVTGTLLGQIQGKYGPQYEIEDEETGQISVIGCGSLKYCYENDRINDGDRVKLIYNGYPLIEKGDFKGKNFHDITVLVDKPDHQQFAPQDDTFMDAKDLM